MVFENHSYYSDLCIEGLFDWFFKLIENMDHGKIFSDEFYRRFWSIFGNRFDCLRSNDNTIKYFRVIETFITLMERYNIVGNIRNGEELMELYVKMNEYQVFGAVPIKLDEWDRTKAYVSCVRKFNNLANSPGGNRNLRVKFWCQSGLDAIYGYIMHVLEQRNINVNDLNVNFTRERLASKCKIVDRETAVEFGDALMQWLDIFD